MNFASVSVSAKETFLQNSNVIILSYKRVKFYDTLTVLSKLVFF